MEYCTILQEQIILVYVILHIIIWLLQELLGCHGGRLNCHLWILVFYTWHLSSSSFSTSTYCESTSAWWWMSLASRRRHYRSCNVESLCFCLFSSAVEVLLIRHYIVAASENLLISMCSLLLCWSCYVLTLSAGRMRAWARRMIRI